MTLLDPDRYRTNGAEYPSDESSPPPSRCLFTVDGEDPRAVVPLVCDLAIDTQSELFIGAPVTVSEQIHPDSYEPRARGERQTAQWVLEAKSSCGDDIPGLHEIVRVGHHRDELIVDMVESFGITTLIEETVPESGFRSIFNGTFDERAVRDTCDVITVSKMSTLDSIDSIVAPIAAGPHSGMAIDVALSLARRNDSLVELLHVEEAGATKQERVGDRILTNGLERTRDFEAVSTTLREADDVSEEIVAYSSDFDITVLGAPREGVLKQFVQDSIPQAVSEEAHGTVLTTHRAGVNNSWLERWVS